MLQQERENRGPPLFGLHCMLFYEWRSILALSVCTEVSIIRAACVSGHQREQLQRRFLRLGQNQATGWLNGDIMSSTMRAKWHTCGTSTAQSLLLTAICNTVTGNCWELAVVHHKWNCNMHFCYRVRLVRTGNWKTFYFSRNWLQWNAEKYSITTQNVESRMGTSDKLNRMPMSTWNLVVTHII